MKPCGALVLACCVFAAGASGPRQTGRDGVVLAVSAQVVEARIAPDGGSIAYIVKSGDGGSNQPREAVWRLPFAGGDPRRLTSSAANESQPRWSPDGREIAFLSRGPSGRERIFRLSSSGADLRPITPDSVDVLSCAWSRDGQRIGVAVRGAAASRVANAFYVLDTASGNMTPLSRQGIEGVSAFSWSPSGSALAVIAADATSQTRIVTLAASEPPREIVADAGRASEIAWSPDGELIAWLSEGEGDDLSARVRIVPAAGGTVRALPGAMGSPVALSWTGNGLLSITLEGSGERHVDTVDVRSGDRVTVFPPGIARGLGAASWSADGTRFAVVGTADDHVPEVFAGSLPLRVPGGRDTVGAPPPPVRRITFSNRLER